MQYYLQLNNPGSGNLSVHRYSAGADDLSIGKLIKVNYRGQERGGWFIENISYDEVKSGERAGEWKNVTGRGAMAVLADGIVYPASGSSDATRIFTNVTMASMLLTLINESKARGCFPDLRTDFSDVLDSNGEPWTDLSTLTFNVDTSLLDVITQLVDLGLEFDFQLDWIVGDYVLYAYQTAIGSDVSASVVFRPGLNCAEVNNKQESGELKNALRVTYNGGATEITDAASIAAYRRREAPFQVGNVTTSGGAVQMATPELTAKKDPQLSISIKVEDAANNPRAFVDYKVGDWVGYDAGDGAAPALYRVRGMMLDFGENDKYAVITVDLNSIRLERELLTAIALRKLGSGVIGSNTSSPMPEGVAEAISAHNLDNTSHATRTLSSGDLAGTIGIPTVAKLRGRAIKNPLTLVDKNLLKWSDANQQFEPGFVDWLEVEGKPSTFAPSAHNHVMADVTDLDAVEEAPFDGKSYVRKDADWTEAGYQSAPTVNSLETHGTVTDEASITFAHTVLAGDNTILLVGISSGNDGETVTSVTYNGDALTKIDEVGGSAVARAQIWYRLLPDTGAHDVVVTFSGNTYGEAGAIAYDNVNQTTPFENEAEDTEVDEITVTSAVNNLVVAMVAMWWATTGSDDAGQTSIWKATSDGVWQGLMSSKPGAASTTLGWTLSTTYSAIMAISLVGFTGIVLEKATGAEINTGTDDTKFITAKAVEDSNIVITDKPQILSNKTLVSPIVSILKPAADGISAIQFTKADGTTPILVLDTLIGRIGININPTECLHILGTTSPLFESTVSSGWGTIVYMDGVGGGGQFVLQRAGGNRESPTAILSGMTLGAFSFRGHNGTGFTGSKGLIVSNATENWSSIANGSNIQFRTTSNGSIVLTNRLTIGADGSITVGDTPSTISLFNIIGSQDRVQAIVRGHSTQTNNLQEWQDSASTVVARINNVGLLSLGIATADSTRLAIYGGRYGTDMLTLVRTEGATQTFGFALNGGGLSFHDVTHSVYPFTLLGSSTIGTVILGQNGKLAGSPIIGVLRGENLASGWATNIAAAELRIIGVVGTGSGAGGDIVFQTGNSGASGTTAHSITTKLTIKGTTGNLVLAEGANLIPGTTTGSKIGDSVTQKLGFWNVAPIVQPSGAAQAAPAAYSTGAYGLDSDAHMQALFDLVVAMRTALVNTGLMKGAA